ncbi:hypothetical protein SAMN04487907_10318 [Zunongwangia mangrovi]|uniref:YqcI/YcgG family protein n=1 Tax=Zunongwangia mangrovi TaxID=1334022 RepID=A0A1I1HLU2_9FLAO|nr:guanitoxin biosynthesis heme-dependent pre-guanitoxin N-hydroxylase GntA [Zunongwangia mangrovi]SFC22423.1 hypothetical protein SAMN04487907_10318 [Zunongwangia mangrovi]
MLKIAEEKKEDLTKSYKIDQIYKDFDRFITGENHPCIMAKTVFSMDNVHLKSYKNLANLSETSKLYEDLKSYIKEYDFDSNKFETFIAVFPDTPQLNELDFEKQLWMQLDQLHKIDNFDWDSRVSNDPDDQNFSFSIAGRSFYIVGLHPNSSRLARRSPFTAITFNLHWQFEKLREMGTYKRVRNTIRKRDKKLQGNINPMLEDFGATSEAKQYSGRKVSEKWECPFKH